MHMPNPANALVASSLVLSACTAPAPQPPTPTAPDLSQLTWVDLTHAFDANTIYWPNNPTGFELDTQYAGTTPGGWYYSSNKLSAPEHGGTHMDAPVHFAENGHSAEQVPVEQLTGYACVIDVADSVQEDADHLVSIAEVEAWEKKHGAIPEHSIVLFRTGWGRYYDAEPRVLAGYLPGSLSLPGFAVQASA